MSSWDSLGTAETVLRELIVQLVPDWATHASVNAQALAEARKTDNNTRPGVTHGGSGITYVDFAVLRKLILVNWPVFKPVFGSHSEDKQRVSVYLNRLNAFRRAAAHNRPLMPFEAALLDGIAGELRNSIILWRGRAGGDLEIWPRIETAHDSFGHDAHHWHTSDPFPLLHPGDQVTFTATAQDVQGVGLHWWLSKTRFIADSGPTADGEQVSFTWQVTDDDIAERRSMHIVLRSNASHHRHGSSGADDSVRFNYRVYPRGIN